MLYFTDRPFKEVKSYFVCKSDHGIFPSLTLKEQGNSVESLKQPLRRVFLLVFFA